MLEIRTNNHKREVVYWWELTEKERKEFDYFNTDEEQSEALFFRYKGDVYAMGEFMRIEHCPDFNGWDGYISDTFYSGVLVKYYEDDYDFVIVGTYFS